MAQQRVALWAAEADIEEDLQDLGGHFDDGMYHIGIYRLPERFCDEEVKRTYPSAAHRRIDADCDAAAYRAAGCVRSDS